MADRAAFTLKALTLNARSQTGERQLRCKERLRAFELYGSREPGLFFLHSDDRSGILHPIAFLEG